MEVLHKLSHLHEQDNGGVKCECPAGFKGDGVKNCEGEIFSYFNLLFIIYFFRWFTLVAVVLRLSVAVI